MPSEKLTKQGAPLTLSQRLHTYAYTHKVPGVGVPQHIVDAENAQPRKVYFNMPLPDSMVSDPVARTPLRTYPRNKIRTTKYTPLNFVPKNLFYQFRNIANAYFLLVVILGAFEIFGVSSPGLAAVPLVVIVCLTAIKDAFEDYRRVVSDMGLNNSGVHILEGLSNPNFHETKVGVWRRFKKWCSALIMKRLAMQRGGVAEKAVPRASVDSPLPLALRRGSLASHPRRSVASTVHPTGRVSAVVPHTMVAPEDVPAPVQAEGKLRFARRYWKDIHVGDVIRINNNEEVPADVVVLATSDGDGGCFVETKNLDGETNLKARHAVHCGEGLRHAGDFLRAQCWLECEGPNPHLYAFKGVVHYTDYSETQRPNGPKGPNKDDGCNGPFGNETGNGPFGPETSEGSSGPFGPETGNGPFGPGGVATSEVVTNENTLLRGCTLRNTRWALGLVIYTGPESKIILNSGITPTKKSRIASELNLSVVFNFAVLFFMCFILGVVNGVFYKKRATSRLFFDGEPYAPTPAANGTLAFFVALIIYQALVPISLYISIEIVKTLQAFFIYSDVAMYYEPLDFPCTPKAWNISDDLGQIEYVFSDKTGTLTQNVMEFKKCSIGGKAYGLAYTEARQGMERREGVDVVAEGARWAQRIAADRVEMLALLHQRPAPYLVDSAVTFTSSEYVRDSAAPLPQQQRNDRFMSALALCHTVVAEPLPLGLLYKAESPDEAALVSVARDVGIVFTARTRKSVTLSCHGQDETHSLLVVVPFTSTRKRMTCVLQDARGTLRLICKGADTVVFERLAAKQEGDSLHRTALHLEDFAKEGLRTLCVAEREVSQAEFDAWKKRYDAAVNSIADDRDDRIAEVCELLERDLVLLGGTAIEDRLQDGVPDSIALLGQAGIKIWVLTGDRIETAINIGFSCNLLESDMKLLVLRGVSGKGSENGSENGSEKDGQSGGEVLDPSSELDQLLTTYLAEFNLAGTPEEVTAARSDHAPAKRGYAVIVDGSALTAIFASPALQRKFLLLGKQCKSVLCCRVSPAQKALVVTLVKDTLQVMTLAIGDGANDVAMIQAANIGVGIAGEEGRQAVMSSDYAIAQFRFLARLLLVHGRWSYKRLAEMIPCFFYKNTTFTFTLFWYGIFNNFDGSYLFEYTYLMLYNLAFTSLPVIFLAVLDQDVSASVSLAVPELYRSGILRQDWSQYKFFWYMLDALYQSAVAFFFPYCLYRVGFNGENGLPQDHRFYIGVTVANIAVVSSNLYVLMRQYRWDYLTGCISAFSILVVFFWTGVWSTNTNGGDFYNTADRVFGTATTWATLFAGIIACLLPRFIIDCIKGMYFPKDVELIRLQVSEGAYDQYPPSYDPTDRAQRLRLRENGASTLDLSEPPSKTELLEANASTDGTKTSGSAPSRHPSVMKRTFHSISRIGRKKMSPLEQMRLNMIREGEYVSSRNSLDHAVSTHELPGLSQADTLIRLQTRHSLALQQ